MASKIYKFTKMAGAGNDFVLIDSCRGTNYKRLALKVCNRSTGLGADGLIVLDHARKADYRMRIFNADGSEAEMCGNGARCLAAYIVCTKKQRRQPFSMETLSGTILAEAEGEGANVRLSDPHGYERVIELTLAERTVQVSYIDTGVPHAVIFVQGLKDMNIDLIGAMIRFHQRFKPRGANVNFVEQVRPGLVAVRTYERGVEGETKACGTGSVASALVAYTKLYPKRLNKKGAVMRVLTASGETLRVSFDLVDGHITNVWLKGSAAFVAKGEYYA